MPIDVARLGEVPVHQSTESVFYRTVHIPEQDDPDPLRVEAGWGRWPTDWTLYTAVSEVVAWAEYCRGHPEDVDAADVTGSVGLTGMSLTALGGLAVDGPLPQRAFYRLTFGFERIADLTSEWAEQVLLRAGFDPANFYVDAIKGYGECPALASFVDSLGWEAMRVPSAAWRLPDGICVPVFQAGRSRLLAVEPLVPAASPTVATAAGTTYPLGTGPGWLASIGP